MNGFAVIFDMDGVIVDNFQYHEKAWELFCKRHGIVLDERFRSKVFGSTNKDHLETFFNRKLTGQEITRYENEKEKIYRDIYSPHIQPVPGLTKFTGLLNQNGIAMALATSSPPVNVEFVLGKTGLTGYFSVIVDASMIKKGKPDPEIYLKTAQKLKMQPANCIVFEDSKVGIQSALHAGMKVIGVSTTHDKAEINNAHSVIPDFQSIDIGVLSEIIAK